MVDVGEICIEAFERGQWAIGLQEREYECCELGWYLWRGDGEECDGGVLDIEGNTFREAVGGAPKRGVVTPWTVRGGEGGAQSSMVEFVRLYGIVQGKVDVA